MRKKCRKRVQSVGSCSFSLCGFLHLFFLLFFSLLILYKSVGRCRRCRKPFRNLTEHFKHKFSKIISISTLCKQKYFTIKQCIRYLRYWIMFLFAFDSKPRTPHPKKISLVLGLSAPGASFLSRGFGGFSTDFLQSVI